MQSIKASEFKAKCLALMDEVARTGKPVAELRPHVTGTRPAAGVWKNCLLIKGDIVAPVDVDWEALK